MRTIYGKIELPVFFPDATRAVVKTVDSVDIKNTGTPGILVNTYHLYKGLGKKVLRKYGGIREFMGWNGAVISDSGGFQVMSQIKKFPNRGKVTDEGAAFHPIGEEKIMLTPEKSVEFQMELKPDMVVVLDDFTDPKANYEEAKDTVERTILWAKRSKMEFEKICKQKKLDKNHRPYLLGVVQGGEFMDLRKECTERLVAIGFDGLGYGGWPIMADGKFNYEAAEVIVKNAPEEYLFYGLGVGKPDEVANCVRMGYTIFDCVLPTRDARHKRLYVFNADSIEEINLEQLKFYAYYVPDKEKYYANDSPISEACDCHLCKNFSRAYLAHLFRIKDLSALRLATIHNLRFYAMLMEKLREKQKIGLEGAVEKRFISRENFRLL